MVTLQLKQIRVTLGQWLILEDIIWRQFEAIIDELREEYRVFIVTNQVEVMCT